MGNSERDDSLGFDQTLFPSSPQLSKKEADEKPLPTGDSSMKQSLGNLNTIGNPVNRARPTPFFSGQLDQGVLSEGLSLGDNYRLDQRLGRGGMGEAWKASDLMADRNVVIKLVPPEIRNAEFAMGQVRDTFLKVHALQHQHICPIMGLIEDPNYGVYLVMKFINGKTLDVYRRDYIAEHGRFPASEAIQILWAVARALDYSHDRKVLHRDVKPQNIMISPEDGVQLIDFGLAAEIRSSMMHVSETPMDMTGTRPYMAPEQWRGRLQDAQTDQYALGVTAYELIAGYLPFQTQDIGVLRECVLNDEPEQIPGIADHINTAIRKAISKRREDRFENCRAFIKAMATKPKETEKNNPPPLPTLKPEILSPPPAPSTSILPTHDIAVSELTTQILPVSSITSKGKKFLHDFFIREDFSFFWAAAGVLTAVLLFLMIWFLTKVTQTGTNPDSAFIVTQPQPEHDQEKTSDVVPSLENPTLAPISSVDNVLPNASPGYHLLFNGRSFREQWRTLGGDWKTENGILTCRENGIILSLQEYENFSFRFDFRFSAGTNNGVLIRVPRDGNAVNGGFEIQIMDDSAPEHQRLSANQRHGSIWNVEAALSGHVKPIGQWNRQEVYVNDKTVRVTLNGVDILSTNIRRYNAQINKSSGYIGFSHMKGTIELRNIEIKDLSPPSASASTPRVIATYPTDKDQFVHTSLREVSVTFDTDMDRRFMDWGTLYHDSPPAAPFAKPYWRSDQTCVMPIQALSPNTEYHVCLNHTNSSGFHGKNGKRVEPFKFRFRTQTANYE